MRALHIVFGWCLLVLVGCSNNQSATKTPVIPLTSKLNNAGTRQLTDMVNSYYAFKDALVKSNAPRADSAALQLVKYTDNFQAYLQTDTANKAILQPYLDTIINECKISASMPDESCERKRIYFGAVSVSMYTLLKKAGAKNGGIYHEYCPMAFNEKGAYWLSNESEIKNPYFGKKMLECGEVTDSL